MSRMIDLDQQATQAAFGALVGIAQPSVSTLMTEGKLPATGTLGELLLAYCARLRDQAAGRMGENTTLDLVQERAALAREQREGQAIKNVLPPVRRLPGEKLLNMIERARHQARGSGTHMLVLQLRSEGAAP